MFKDEHKGRSFSQESSWDILRKSPKWDAPEQVMILMVDVEGTSGRNAELFGQDKRPRPARARVGKRQNLRARRYRWESNDDVCGYDAKRVATQTGDSNLGVTALSALNTPSVPFLLSIYPFWDVSI
nr:hypothetical protein [Tanacetum cinerariifolium]